MLIVVVAAVLASAAFLWVRSAQMPPYGYLMADPDCYIRWNLVERALAGEGVRTRSIAGENAPYGRINEWTAPMTIIGVTAVRITEALGLPRDKALRLCGLWLGPALGLGALALLGVLGWRAGGGLLAVCWLLAFPSSAPEARRTSSATSLAASIITACINCSSLPCWAGVWRGPEGSSSGS